MYNACGCVCEKLAANIFSWWPGGLWYCCLYLHRECDTSSVQGHSYVTLYFCIPAVHPLYEDRWYVEHASSPAAVSNVLTRDWIFTVSTWEKRQPHRTSWAILIFLLLLVLINIQFKYTNKIAWTFSWLDILTASQKLRYFRVFQDLHTWATKKETEVNRRFGNRCYTVADRRNYRSSPPQVHTALALCHWYLCGPWLKRGNFWIRNSQINNK